MPFSEHLPGDTGSHQVRAQAPSLHGHSVCLLGQSQASGAWRAGCCWAPGPGEWGSQHCPPGLHEASRAGAAGPGEGSEQQHGCPAPEEACES